MFFRKWVYSCSNILVSFHGLLVIVSRFSGLKGWRRGQKFESDKQAYVVSTVSCVGFQKLLCSWVVRSSYVELEILYSRQYGINKWPIRNFEDICYYIKRRSFTSNNIRNIFYFRNNNELWCFQIPPLLSSGQSSWLQIQRFRVRFPSLPDFLSSNGSGTGSTQPREDNWEVSWMEINGSGDPLHWPRKSWH
jgi:hypothetical protein